MNTTNKVGLLAAAVLLSVGFAAAIDVRPVSAQAATTPDTSKKISLTVTQAPIQSVLKTLFGSEGVNYTIDQDVQGNVTVDINEVTFDTALHALLRSTNPPLTYTIEGDNIYHVKVKQADTTGSGNGITPTGDLPPTASADYSLYKIPIDRYDATYIAMLLANGGNIVNVGPNSVIGSASGGGAGGQRNGGLGTTANGTSGTGGFGGNTGGFGGSPGGYGGSTGGFGGTPGGTTGGLGGTTGSIGGMTF